MAGDTRRKHRINAARYEGEMKSGGYGLAERAYITDAPCHIVIAILRERMIRVHGRPALLIPAVMDQLIVVHYDIRISGAPPIVRVFMPRWGGESHCMEDAR